LLSDDILLKIFDEIVNTDDFKLDKIKSNVMKKSVDSINNLDPTDYIKFKKILSLYSKNIYGNESNTDKIKNINTELIDELLLNMSKKLQISDYIDSVGMLSKSIKHKEKTYTEIIPKHIENIFQILINKTAQIDDERYRTLLSLSHDFFKSIDFFKIIPDFYIKDSFNKKIASNIIRSIFNEKEFSLLLTYMIERKMPHDALLNVRKDYTSVNMSWNISFFRLGNISDIPYNTNYELYKYIDAQIPFYNIINLHDFNEIYWSKNKYGEKNNYFDFNTLNKLIRYFPQNIDYISEPAIYIETKIKSIESRIKFFEKKDGSLFVKPEMLLRDLYLTNLSNNIPDNIDTNKLKELYLGYIEYYNQNFKKTYNKISQQNILDLNKKYKNSSTYMLEYTPNISSIENFAFYYNMKSEYIKKEMSVFIDRLNNRDNNLQEIDI
jgi:hypothetical protein